MCQPVRHYHSATRPYPQLPLRNLFFFGFIFFSLDLISEALQPLHQSERLRSILAIADAPLLAVLSGLVFTAIVQSSSVTTGLAIVLVQSGIMPPETAIQIVIGANVGSTSTALIASLGMGRSARRSAIANFAFNAVGMLAYMPFLRPFSRWVVGFADSPGFAVAWAHLLFNLSVGMVLMLLLPVILRWLPWADPERADAAHR
jgi:Na/Pi-cotransporter